MDSKDLTGKRFGEWTVLSRSKDKPSGYWLCQCSCGVKKDVWATSLKRGRSKSCGHAKSAEALKKSDQRMIGRRFGRLVILERVNDTGKAQYLCQCDCGNQAVVKSHYLVNGKTKSCGCLRREKSARSIQRTYKPLEEERKRATQYGSNVHHLSQKLSKNSKTKRKGVSKMASGKYRAYLYFEGKQYYGGTHDTLEEAAAARRELEKKYFEPIKEKYEE